MTGLPSRSPKVFVDGDPNLSVTSLPCVSVSCRQFTVLCSFNTPRQIVLGSPPGWPVAVPSSSSPGFYCGCSCCASAGVGLSSDVLPSVSRSRQPLQRKPPPSASTEPLPALPQSLPSTAAEPVPSSAEPLPSSGEVFPSSPDPWSSSTNYTAAQTSVIPPPTAAGPYGGLERVPGGKRFPQASRVAFTTSCG